MRVEFEQGKNIANAAAKTSTLKHFIWSTLPDAAKISNEKYLVPHFAAKNKVDKYIKSNADLYAKTTFLWLTYFAQNYSSPMFTPNFVVSGRLAENSRRHMLKSDRKPRESMSNCSRLLQLSLSSLLEISARTLESLRLRSLLSLI